MTSERARQVLQDAIGIVEVGMPVVRALGDATDDLKELDEAYRIVQVQLAKTNHEFRPSVGSWSQTATTEEQQNLLKAAISNLN